jgi:hypothetical protein
MTTAAQAASLEAATLVRIDSALAEQTAANAAATAAALALAETEKAAQIAAAIEQATLDANAATAAAAAAAAAEDSAPVTNAQFKVFKQEQDALKAELAALKSGGSATPIVDKKPYLDIRADDRHKRIEAGIPVLPPHSAPNKPNLYDLRGDATFDALAANPAAKGQLEEVKILICLLLYLSVAIKAIEEKIVLEPGSSDEEELQPVFNTLHEVESWFRKRLAFIRSKADSGNTDPNWIEYLRNKIYGQTNSANLGSSFVESLREEYETSKQRQVQSASAKEGAKAQLTANKPESRVANNAGREKKPSGKTWTKKQ